MRPPRPFGSPVLLEALNFKSSVPSKGRLDILYRVPYSAFVFVKNQSPTGAPFHARGDITIDVFERNGGPVTHTFIHKLLDVAEPPSISEASLEFVEGMTSFDLAPGVYKIAVEANDRESNRSEHNELDHIAVNDFTGAGLQISDVLFTHPLADSAGKLIPLNFGNEVPFGDRFGMYAEIMSPHLTGTLRLRWKIDSVNNESHERKIVASDSLSLDSVRFGRDLSVKREGENFSYVLAPRMDSSRPFGVWAPINSDTLQQGSYELQLTGVLAESSVTRTFPFQIRWIDKPMSLRSLRTAVEALSYLADPAEFDDLRHADGDEQEALFNAFWKKRDPTPQTAYNEAEAEYYKRVDHASTAFSTVGEQNGAKTDRGKAYILYGPPSSTTRSLNPSSLPTEVWIYINLHRRLIFTDKSKQGNYVLTAQEKFD
ncbi:MAG TPA: GWxTD domain-containing protein [Bacteroidota bacterium]|nr:GWxTD domain-containing protein [Bacteroidota bacterium]